MTVTGQTIGETAVEWFARLRNPAADEAAWLDFRDWIEADDRHRQAYAELEALWLDLDDGLEPAAEQPRVIPFQPKPRRPAVEWRAAAAAVGALMIGGVLVTAYLLLPDRGSQTYRAPPDAPRTLQLADGSRVTMDRGSELKVGLGRRLRSVELVEGEASFQVVHDAGRPFVVAAGDKSVTVLGTEFDVLRHDGRLRVTVARGVVAVGAPEAEQAGVRLVAGEQYEQRSGKAEPVRRVNPADVAGWNRGLLIYRNASLHDVAEDVGRYAGVRVRVAPSAESLTFSGVLKIAEGRAMLDRLQAFLPLTAAAEAGGLVIRRRAPPNS